MQPILEARGLTHRFALPGGGYARALDNVTLAVYPGEILGLTGESGAGKSTLGRCFLGLELAQTGELLFAGKPVRTAADRRTLRAAAGMIFQDPGAAMNPRLSVLEIVAEPLRLAKISDRTALRSRAAALLAQVGLDASMLTRYPDSLSGGQQQRVCIARALARSPAFLVADEPAASLDASAAAQVWNLLLSLAREQGLACLLITHDLAAARRVCDRVGVLRAGELLELAPAETIFTAPQHAYTRALVRT